MVESTHQTIIDTARRVASSPLQAQEPVGLDLEKYRIEDLFFMPLSYIERGCYPQELLQDPDEDIRVFYSLDELARQVRARIMIHGLRMEM